MSFSEVMRGSFGEGTFDGKFVVIGTTAPSLQDVHPTSTTGGDTMSGPEIQASALATVRAGVPLQSSPAALDVGLIVLFALIAPFGAVLISPLRGLLLAIVVGVAYAIVVQLSFEWEGLILSFFYPLGTLTVATVGTVAVHYVTATMERQRTRDIFARFVPESVVDQVLARTDEDLRLGGTRARGDDPLQRHPRLHLVLGGPPRR